MKKNSRKFKIYLATTLLLTSIGFSATGASAQNVNSNSGPKITVTSNTCTKKVDGGSCLIEMTLSEDSDFTWTDVCGVHPDGGGNWDGIEIQVELTGPKQTCDLTFSATSFRTSKTSTKTFKIYFPGS